jgi:hypothetical protein
MDKEESYRIHLDWWHQCRTCKHWLGDRGNMSSNKCGCVKSSLYDQATSSCGHCEEWDSFDIDTAIKVLEDNEQEQNITNISNAIRLRDDVDREIFRDILRYGDNRYD